MNLFYTFLNNVLYYLSKIDFSSPYLKVGLIVILLFILVVTLAETRKHFVKWSLKGGLMGLFFGFLLTLIIEGFLLISGKTIFTSLLGWKDAPKPFSTALDLGKGKLINVLGVSTNDPSPNDALNVIQSLDPSEVNKVRSIICTP